MIIVASKPGRLGNMLIVYANLLAFQEEHRISVWNPAFHQYSRYFAGTAHGSRQFDKLIFKLAYYKARVIARLKLGNSFFATKHLNWQERLDLDGVDPKELPRILFLQGWQIRAGKLLQKHAPAIRNFFRPAEKYEKQLNDFWNNRIDKGQTVIGIHVRRGDYSTFENGSYFYALEEYETVIKNIQALFGSEQICFLLSCSEIPPAGAFQDPALKIVFAPGHELLDLYALSRCHFLAGPPSTYSMWASFYGEVPLYMIRDPKVLPQRTDFRIQTSF